MSIEIPMFQTAKVVVVGDVMLDRYWHGATSRISPEAPVPVVHVQSVQERPGGAGNVALNLRALGCDVRLMGMVGQDEAAQSLNDQLVAEDIFCHLQAITGVPTTTKLRVMGRNQQLIRLDFEQDFRDQSADILLGWCKTHLVDTGALILSDYGKGTLANVQQFICLAEKFGVPVLVDPKGADFSRYRGATLVTPNFKEFEAVVGTCRNDTEIVEKAMALLHEHNFTALLVTRGEHGMTLVQKNHDAQHFPARAKEVFDVTGAGDTVIAVLSAALSAGARLSDAVVLANTAAGIAVSKLGSATVSVPELRRALQRHHDSEFGVLSEDELLVSVADARAHGESIVMTNGCFDILHAGHVAYLQQAKALGKRLIVAVNDDASVAKLKGDGRPINSLTHRMSVLAALRAVDWVVSFSEDTPTRLIRRVLPDVLVKGGDYLPNQIAGNDDVIANGGEVKVLPFVPGCSTTSMIERITS